MSENLKNDIMKSVQGCDCCSKTSLSSRISPNCPSMKFYFNNCEINVKSVNFSPNGEIESVVTYYEENLSGPSLKFEKYLLEVPGVGFICPGTRVYLDNKQYVLCHGWHTNISNQTIFSWYLHPLFEGSTDKTLYRSDIDKLEKFTFV